MRHSLAKYCDSGPKAYTGTYIVSSIGYNRQNIAVHTTLLKDVKTPEGKPIDGDGHIWLVTQYPVKGFKEGDRIEIVGTIGKYKRSDGTKDYSFIQIYNIKKISEEPEPQTVPMEG